MALARALVNNPKLIIADEPTGNIDPELSYEIVDLLNEINKVGTTILMVTHEHDLVAQFNHRVITIDDGSIVRDDTDWGAMKGSSFSYLIKEGARNIWVNRMMSLASIGILVSCMLLIGSAILLSINLNGMVSYVENQNEMVAFLEDSADDVTVSAVEAALNSNDNVDSFAFVSREEALDVIVKLCP